MVAGDETVYKTAVVINCDVISNVSLVTVPIDPILIEYLSKLKVVLSEKCFRTWNLFYALLNVSCNNEVGAGDGDVRRDIIGIDRT